MRTITIRNSKIRTEVFIFLLLIFLNLGFFVIKDPDNRAIFVDIISPINNFFAVVCLFLAAKFSKNLQPKLAKGWLILTIAQFLYAVGDLIWLVIEVILHQSPYPSAADIFYIAYYPLFFAGAIFFIPPTHIKMEWAKKTCDISIVILATFLAFWNYVIFPLSITYQGQPLTTQILTLAYPFGDLIVFCMAFWMIENADHSEMFKPALYISASAIMLVFTDIYFSYHSLIGNYHSGTFVDIGWIVGYLLIAQAALVQIRLIDGSIRTPRFKFFRSFDPKIIMQLMSFYPYLWLFYIYILLLPNNRTPFIWNNPLNFLGVGALLLIAFTRSVLSILENNVLVEKLQNTLKHVQQQAVILEQTNRELLSEMEVREKAEKQLIYDSTHDPLTDLPNRLFFEMELKKAIDLGKYSKEKVFSVFLLDIDQFQIINDSMGHKAGDELLKTIAERLRGCLQEEDIVARVGGDEFAILYHSTAKMNGILSAANCLQSNICREVNLFNHSVIITSSVGILLDSSRYDSQVDAFRDADIALYHAKTHGKNQIEIFKPAMQTEAYSRLEIEEDLRSALSRNEFELYYQPIVNLANSKLSGFEALIRWQHPRYGFLTPGDFITTAEESDLIVPIGQWVMEEACRQIRVWQLTFPEMKHLKVHVNISARQLIRPNFVSAVQCALELSGLSAESLRLEITESIGIGNYEQFLDKFKKLNDLGIHLEIDDFGTGYSSLSYIQNLPFDTLKIAMPFVQEIATRRKSVELITTINSMAKSLGLETIAEGIETEFQLNKLKEIGVNYGQGYLFSKPVNKTQAVGIMENNLFLVNQESPSISN